MDYEKAYKAAKRVAAHWIENGCEATEKILLETIFPELKESDDERIRKEMIEFLNQYKEDGLRGVDITPWIAYLEKQKINTEGDFGRGYNCGYEACLNSHGAEWFEKQKEQKLVTFEEPCNSDEYEAVEIGNATCLRRKEQKPAEWSEDDEEEFSNLTTLLFILEGNGSIKQGVASHYQNWLNSFRNKSKQEWSVDDKQYVEDILALLQFGASKHSTRQVESWLKSLPERFNLPPKQEWSEEDLQHKSWILECLADGEKKMPEYAEDFQAAYKWLKSLRPQWKPSDEQLRPLEYAIDYFKKKKNDTTYLESLYNDLKKL